MWVEKEPARGLPVLQGAILRRSAAALPKYCHWTRRNRLRGSWRSLPGLRGRRVGRNPHGRRAGPDCDRAGAAVAARIGLLTRPDRVARESRHGHAQDPGHGRACRLHQRRGGQPLPDRSRRPDGKLLGMRTVLRRVPARSLASASHRLLPGLGGGAQVRPRRARDGVAQPRRGAPLARQRVAPGGDPGRQSGPQERGGRRHHHLEAPRGSTGAWAAAAWLQVTGGTSLPDIFETLRRKGIRSARVALVGTNSLLHLEGPGLDVVEFFNPIPKLATVGDRERARRKLAAFGTRVKFIVADYVVRERWSTKGAADELAFWRTVDGFSWHVFTDDMYKEEGGS